MFSQVAGGGNSALDKPTQNTPQTETPLVTADGVNSTPVATFSTFKINKDTSYDGQLTATDADGDTLKYIIVDAPTYGTVILHDNGCFTYTPDSGYKGSDTFSYRANDDISSCAVKTVTVNVSEESIKIPFAPTNLQIKALSTTKLELTWSDNSDNEEGFVIYRNGKLVASTNTNETKKIICCGLKAGTTYTFEVRAKNVAGSSIAVSSFGTTKDITTAPTAPTELKAKAIGKTCLRLEWKDNADNESTYKVYQDNQLIKTISSGCHCTVVGGLKSCETYNFIVKAVNKIGSSSSNTISVETVCDVVSPVNSAPIAMAQSVTLDEDTHKEITLTGTDSDGDTLSFTIITPPTNGTFDGTTYTPTPNYHGSDSFSFTANDGSLTSAPATVSIVITDVAEANHAPVAIAQSVTLDEDTSTGITLTGTDADGDSLTYTVVTPPSHGVFNGTIYTPDADYNGIDSFSFKANDGKVDSNIESISINIQETTIKNGIFKIPATGIKYTYTAFDDGFYQFGIKRDFERDDTKDVVVDKVTGLMWSDDGRETGYNDQGYCTSLTLGDYDDWRTPNMNEILQLTSTLTTVSKFKYSIGARRRLTLAGPYVNLAYYFFMDGRIRSDAASSSDYSAHDAKCVRGVNKIKHNFLRDDTKDVVLDTESLLMWQDNNISIDTISYKDAIHYCENLELSDYDDWRLPNLNELITLLDASKPKIPAVAIVDGFKYSEKHAYWTSTMDYNHTKNRVNFNQSYNNEITKNKVRCVRFIQEGNEINNRPTIESLAVTTNEDEYIDIILTGDDEDLDSLTYLALNAKYGNITKLNKNLFRYTPEKDFFGDDNLSIYTFDGLTPSYPSILSITVNPVFGDNPVALIKDIGSSLKLGHKHKLESISYDPDKTSLTYEWTEDGELLGTEQNLSKNDFSLGEHTIMLTVTNDEGLSSQTTKGIVVIESTVPVIHSVSVQGEYDGTRFTDGIYYIDEDDYYSIRVSASDADGDSLTYTLNGKTQTSSTFYFEDSLYDDETGYVEYDNDTGVLTATYTIQVSDGETIVESVIVISNSNSI